MPAKFETLPIRQVMYHRAAYDLIAQNGPMIYPEWNLIDFEKEAVSFDGDRYAFDK